MRSSPFRAMPVVTPKGAAKQVREAMLFWVSKKKTKG
jgi:hypothetical protein